MEQRIKTMISLGALGAVLPFFGIPIVPKMYIVSALAAVYTLIAFSLLQSGTKQKETAEQNDVYDRSEHTTTNTYGGDFDGNTSSS